MREGKTHKGSKIWLFLLIAMATVHLLIILFYMILYEKCTLEVVFRSFTSFHIHLWGEALTYLFREALPYFILTSPIWLLYPILLGFLSEKFDSKAEEDKSMPDLKLIQENVDKEKPVMVLKYTAPRVASLTIVFSLFPLMYLVVYNELYQLNTFDYYFVKYGGLLFSIGCLWIIVDLLNTKQIEVYRDRIVKRVRITFPTQRDKTVYFVEARYELLWVGILLSKTRWIAQRKGFILYTTRLKKEDQIRLAEFLAKVSGRPKEVFLYRPAISNFSFEKLIVKEGTHGTDKQ